MYNGTVKSNVYVPAVVDLIAQGLVAIGDKTEIYTP
jgi:hypothetical protein